MGRFQAPLVTGSVDLIVPVPLHPARMRKRGFNQAFQMIRQWPGSARQQGMGIKASAISDGILVRTRNTPPQTGLRRAERRENLKAAFAINGRASVRGKRLLLVDDVMTTGATVESCSKALLQGGAASVDVLTLARA